MSEKLVRNRLRCKKCLDIIESKHVHDFVRCKCGSIFVDGGQEYCRYGCPESPAEDWIEFLTEYDDS
jgi:hypothetical protein